MAAQLFTICLDRKPDELDGPAYQDRDGPIPAMARGALFQIAGSYYF